MKVVVRCANNRVIKTEMEREIERLFQENKDLRVQVGHLRNELSLAQQQSEARRQVICERDKLIQELDEELAKSKSESSQGITTMAKFWEEAVNEKHKAEELAEEYHIALMESDCRVDECEKRMDWLSKEVLEWKATAEGYKNQYEELKAQKEVEDKKSEEICTACNERYEDVLSERNRLREEVKRLTNERDVAVTESTEMTFKIDELLDKWEAEHNLHTVANRRLEELQEEHNELEADYDALVQTKREYAEEIDRLRKVVIELQTNRFTYDEFIGMIMKNFMPSTDK